MNRAWKVGRPEDPIWLTGKLFAFSIFLAGSEPRFYHTVNTQNGTSSSTTGLPGASFTASRMASIIRACPAFGEFPVT